MEVYRAGATPAFPGPADWFTGQVQVEILFNQAFPDRVQGAKVTFQPGARTAWHTHPLGQTIYVTDGIGRCQRDGGPVITIYPGDSVFFAAHEKHWHGAAPDQAMTHIAVQEVENGKVVDWLEQVSDADYGA